jgi:hypothetical protein
MLSQLSKYKVFDFKVCKKKNEEKISIIWHEQFFFNGKGNAHDSYDF